MTAASGNLTAEVGRKIVAAAVVTALVCGCAAVPPPETPAANSWMSARDDGIALLVWTLAGPTIAGTVNWTYVAGVPDHSPKSLSGTLSGTLAGGSLTVTLSATPSGPMTWTGTVTAARLRLMSPTPNGQLTTYDFVPADAATFNSAVAAFDAVQAGLEARDAAASGRVAEASASAANVAEQEATSCTITTTDRVAAATASGGPGAIDECRRLLVLTTPGRWSAPIYPGGQALGRRLCSGTANGYAVAIAVTAGSRDAGALCERSQLPVTVESGDTTGGIAKLLGITVEQLLCYNAITDPSQLTIGQRLRVPPADYSCPG